MRLRVKRPDEIELNLISLVDVVLLLVIFFMLSTTFIQDSRLRVELPEAGSVRMIGNLLGDPTQDVTIGAPVEAVFEPHDDAAPPFTLVQWRRSAP